MASPPKTLFGKQRRAMEWHLGQVGGLERQWLQRRSSELAATEVSHSCWIMHGITEAATAMMKRRIYVRRIKEGE